MMMQGNLIIVVETWQFDPVHINDAPSLWIMFFIRL